MFYTVMPSPVDDLFLASDGTNLTQLLFGADAIEPDPAWTKDDAPFETVMAQLDEYFAGRRRTFDLPLRPEGTAFQKSVWTALLDIPWGETTSYGTLAKRIGNPKAVRAVGLANGKNPISIIVPCHRVIGADGSLTGYGGGLDRKRFLLALENKGPDAQASFGF